MELTNKQKKNISFILWVCQQTEDTESELQRRKSQKISVKDIRFIDGVLWLNLSNNKKFTICKKRGICSVSE